MFLAKFAVEKRVVSALMTALILGAGYLAYEKLPRFEDPEFIIRKAQIITSYPGASAAEVADEVTDVIENAAQQLTGLKEVRSVSSSGLSEVTVEFTIAAAKTRPALNQKFTQLRAKVSDIAGRIAARCIHARRVRRLRRRLRPLLRHHRRGVLPPGDRRVTRRICSRSWCSCRGFPRCGWSGCRARRIFIEYRPARLVQLRTVRRSESPRCSKARTS